MVEEKFVKMAQKIYINPDPKVIASIANEYQFIQNHLELLKAIDVEGIEPMSRICPPIKFTSLRADQIDQQVYLNKKVLLANAVDKDEDFVIIKRIFQ